MVAYVAIVTSTIFHKHPAMRTSITFFADDARQALTLTGEYVATDAARVVVVTRARCDAQKKAVIIRTVNKSELLSTYANIHRPNSSSNRASIGRIGVHQLRVCIDIRPYGRHIAYCSMRCRTSTPRILVRCRSRNDRLRNDHISSRPHAEGIGMIRWFDRRSPFPAGRRRSLCECKIVNINFVVRYISAACELTCAILRGDGIAIEARSTNVTRRTISVIQAQQTLAGDAIAAAFLARIDVSVAFTRSA